MNDAIQVVNIIRDEGTFIEFECNICVAQDRGYIAKVYDVFLREFGKYDYLAKVNENKHSLESQNDNVHQTPEEGRTVAYSKRP